MKQRQAKHAHARSHLRRKLERQRDGRQPQLVERSPEREARSGTVSKTFQPIQRVAHYVGSFPVTAQGDGAHQFVKDKMNKLILSEKSVNGKPVKVFILPTGVKVYQVDGETLFMAHALPRIQFTVPLPERKLFAFIAVNPPNKGGETLCHCFLTSQPEAATEISTLVNKAFKLAYAARVSNEEKFDEDRPAALRPDGGPEPQKPPSKPPRSAAALKPSHSSVEGQRPNVTRRPVAGSATLSRLPASAPTSPTEEPSLDEQIAEQQREIDAEKQRLMEMKREIAQRRSNQVGGTPTPKPAGLSPGSSRTVPRGMSKGPPPTLPERVVGDALGKAATLQPGASAPTSAAAASQAALANRASFKGGTPLKRRVKAKSKSETALPGLATTAAAATKPSVPPREAPPEIQGVTARDKPPRVHKKPRPASVAEMPSYSSGALPPLPPTTEEEDLGPPRPSSSTALRSQSVPSASLLVDSEYDAVESREAKTETIQDRDYDLVAFDGPPAQPPPPTTPPPPIEPSPPPPIAKPPKAKPRQSIRRPQRQSQETPHSNSSEGIKVQFHDDKTMYDDPEDDYRVLERSEETEDRPPLPPPKDVPELPRPDPRAAGGVDFRIRSNSVDYSAMEFKPPEGGATSHPLAKPRNTPSAELLDDYEIMADQPSPKPRHETVAATPGVPEIPVTSRQISSGSDDRPALPPAEDEEADIDEELRQLHLEEQSLQEAEWFQATIPREVAMDILREQPIGGFIVRNSRTTPGSYSLTVKSPNRKLISFLIRRHPDKLLYTLSDTGTEVFNDLPSLIDYYTQHQGNLPCKLNPIIANPAAHQKEQPKIVDEDYEKFDFTQVLPWQG